MRDYVEKFSSLMLDINNMLDEDKLFNFMSGLQSWAQIELQTQAIKDLLAIIATADGLVDSRFINTSPSESKKSKDSKKDNSSCDGEKKNSSQNKTKQGNPQRNKSSGCFMYLYYR